MEVEDFLKSAHAIEQVVNEFLKNRGGEIPLIDVTTLQDSDSKEKDKIRIEIKSKDVQVSKIFNAYVKDYVLKKMFRRWTLLDKLNISTGDWQTILQVPNETAILKGEVKRIDEASKEIDFKSEGEIIEKAASKAGTVLIFNRKNTLMDSSKGLRFNVR